MPIKLPSFRPRRDDYPPDLWTKCPSCGDMLFNKQLEKADRICPNCDHHFRLSAGARLAVFPELALCGYPPRDLLMKPAFIAACEKAIDALAAKVPQGLTVAVGTAPSSRPDPRASATGPCPSPPLRKGLPGC